MKFYDTNVKPAIIDKSDENYPMMRMEINGHSYGFSVRDYPEKHWDWLCEVFTRNMTLAFEQGKKSGIKEVQEPLGKAIAFLIK